MSDIVTIYRVNIDGVQAWCRTQEDAEELKIDYSCQDAPVRAVAIGMNARDLIALLNEFAAEPPTGEE